MLDSCLYLACIDSNGESIRDTNSCAMCKRQVINAGIREVYIRDTKTEYRKVNVYEDWVLNDDSLEYKEGY